MRTFKRYVGIFVTLLMISVCGCGEESEQILDPDSADETSEKGSSPLPVIWHALSQSEKNQRIIQVALDDFGVNVRKSCKEWVRKVIKQASNEHVNIPSNTSNGDSWELDTAGHAIRYNTSPTRLETSPGHIVQMQWKAGVGSRDSEYNMHTAIVLSVFPNGVIFIESNYDDTPANEEDAVVGIRFVSEKEFNEQVEAFTIYTIR